MRVKLATTFVAIATSAAMAGPKVVTDIPPVHSLVSSVMGDVGTPELILRPGASPHGYAMAPSEARALAGADLVFWVGPALTPWLDRAIDTMATNARAVDLMDADGVATLPFREGALFEEHDHGHEEHDAHEEHEEHEEHEKADDTHDEHNHADGALDPHIWLDPRNAQMMTKAIVSALAEADPENADIYRRNGAALSDELQALEADLAETLHAAKGRPFIVFHDAYHYLEARFDVEAAGAIALSDAATPGPARLTEIREAISTLHAPCIFAEPQFPETLARLVMEGTDAQLAVLDPMGTKTTPGPEHYGAMMRDMANAMAGCLAE